MKRSEAAKYARWSAAAALLLATFTAGVYIERKWVGRQEKKKAPPPAPQDVARLSSGLTISKAEGPQKIFTVEASRATDFKDKEASLLEDVKVTIFGRTGARHDTIHTQSCQYEKESGSIACSGEVQFDLQSAADVERPTRAATAQKVHVETRGVTFNRATGIARSDQPVQFVFPNGRGEATGLEYRSEEGAIRLLRDVSFSLVPPARNGGKPASRASSQEALHVTGKSLDYRRDSRVLHLHGPVEAQTGRARLLAGEVTLYLDKAFRAEKLVAAPGANGRAPTVESQETGVQTNFRGETLTAHFASEGWLTSVEGAGGAQGAQRSPKEVDEFSAETASLELRHRTNQPKTLILRGNVELKTTTENVGESRSLQTSALLVEFAEQEKGQSRKLERAETLARGILEWTGPVTPAVTSDTSAGVATARTKLAADRLEMQFGAEGKAKQLVATGNVLTERVLPNKPLQTATAQGGVAQLLDTGGWSQIELQGDVKLKEGDRSGEADRAVFVRSTQTATLTGKALVRDTSTETKAPRITFAQSSGEIRAEGGVRSTDFSAKGSSLQLAAVPANLSADTFQANSKTGRALYSGHSRLWQGDTVMEADAIELLRESKTLKASGHVRAVFPQAAGPAQAPAQALAVGQPSPKKAKLWHITAGMLTYNDAEGSAHLEKNVVAKSAEQTIRAPVVDLYLTRSVKAGSVLSSTPASSNLLGGAQQISRAIGTGGVIVEQGTRRATAERGEYSAADGKFVMSGGNPTIFDASEGTTTGHQLTFFLADDTIIVDSENGSRTLTKHRVEK